ncbi:MAG TPA: hypothetical protein VMF58_11080 [Rhizomicrobium sp.]|nr:hypothetical protein [Rhizomicrobium sp.]
METQLELLTDAMRGSVARADNVDGDDEYGHRRNNHIGEAVKIGAVSAQIVVALGKYAGEFNHNIHVKRSDAKAESKADMAAKIRNRRRLTDEEWESRRTEYELPRSSSHPPLDRWLKEEWAERDAEAAAEAAAAAKSAEGVPPDENPGSNG